MPSECPRCHCYTVKYHDCEEELRQQAEREKNVDPKVKARLYASLDGATCAKEGKKLDANPYAETDDLHFVWLGAWTDKRMQMLKSGQNVEPSYRDGEKE